MNLKLVSKIPYLIILPKKYFRDTILGREFQLKHILVICAVIFSILTLLHFFEFDGINRYETNLQMFVYLFAFVLGLSVSFLFRIYFLKLILRRKGFNTGKYRIEMVVAISMITNIIVLLLSMIMNTPELDFYLRIVSRIWNLIIILFGLLVLTKIRILQGVTVIAIIFFVEMLFIYSLGGIKI